MADKIVQYFKYVGDELGVGAKIKLAMMTKVPSTKAAMVEDSRANLDIFCKAVAELTGKPAPKY